MITVRVDLCRDAPVCGDRRGPFVCVLTVVHSVTPDGRIRHYYRKPVTR